jgi:predicted GNAT superfamily acetyltransferase
METVTETLASTAHASGERVAIRAVEDYRRCEELQTTVWGPDDIVGIPLLGLVTAQDNGGIVLGAFRAGWGARGVRLLLSRACPDGQAQAVLGDPGGPP